LDQLEAEVDNQFAQHSGRAPEDADVERNSLYSLAADTDQKLGAMLNTLNSLAKDLNANFENQMDESNPVSRILKILNAHHQSLSWLESNSKALDQEVATLGRQMQKYAEP